MSKCLIRWLEVGPRVAEKGSILILAQTDQQVASRTNIQEYEQGVDSFCLLKTEGA